MSIEQEHEILRLFLILEPGARFILKKEDYKKMVLYLNWMFVIEGEK